MNRKIISCCFVVAALMLARSASSQSELPAATGDMPAPSSQETVPIVPATLADGTFVNVTNLRSMGAGLSKNQVHDLIGPPHSTVGVFFVREWNYLFNFRRSGQFYQCQYQVKFDKDMKAESTEWADPACAEFLNQPKVDSAVVPVEAEEVASSTASFTLRSDAIFSFGKASIGAVTPVGRKDLNHVLDQLKEYKKITSIDIVGHADRIGSASANQRLSLARANAVRTYFIEQGLEESTVRAKGVGATQPVSNCPSGNSKAAIACLKVDRRVVVTVNGKNKNLMEDYGPYI